MEVRVKGAGVLIDELITTSMKLWYLQEECRKDISHEEKGKILDKIQPLNVRRNALINAIDEIINPDVATTTKKTYG